MSILIIGNNEENIRKFISGLNTNISFISLKEFVDTECIANTTSDSNGVYLNQIRDISIFSNRVKELYENGVLPNIIITESTDNVRPAILKFLYTEIHIEQSDGNFRTIRKKPEDVEYVNN